MESVVICISLTHKRMPAAVRETVPDKPGRLIRKKIDS